MEFSRQEYWRGLPFPSPGDLPWPRDWTQVSHIANRQFNLWATRGLKQDKRWDQILWKPRVHGQVSYEEGLRDVPESLLSPCSSPPLSAICCHVVRPMILGFTLELSWPALVWTYLFSFKYVICTHPLLSGGAWGENPGTGQEVEALEKEKKWTKRWMLKWRSVKLQLFGLGNRLSGIESISPSVWPWAGDVPPRASVYPPVKWVWVCLYGRTDVRMKWDVLEVGWPSLCAWWVLIRWWLGFWKRKEDRRRVIRGLLGKWPHGQQPLSLIFFNSFKNYLGGLPWQLRLGHPMQGVWVQSLVRELRSHCHGAWPNTKNK